MEEKDRADWGSQSAPERIKQEQRTQEGHNAACKPILSAGGGVSNLDFATQTFSTGLSAVPTAWLEPALDENNICGGRDRHNGVSNA